MSPHDPVVVSVSFSLNIALREETDPLTASSIPQIAIA